MSARTLTVPSPARLLTLPGSGRIGVHLGDDAVRAVSVTGRPDHLEVRRAATVPLPSGAIRAGVITDTETVAQALLDALTQVKAGRDGFVLTHGSAHTLVDTIEIPDGLKTDELETYLRGGGAQLSPLVPVETATLALNVTGGAPAKRARRAKDGTGATVAEAAPRLATVALIDPTEVETLRELCLIAKVTPRALDLTGPALARALPTPAVVDAIVEIGHTRTTVVVRDEHRVRTVRTLETGLAALADAAPALDLAGQNLDPAADTTLTDVTDLEAVLAHGALTAAADALIEQVVSVLDAETASAARPVTPVTAFTLTGPGALQPGLPARFTALTGTPATATGPAATLARGTTLHTEATVPSAAADTDVTADLLIEFATAIGAAQWKKTS